MGAKGSMKLFVIESKPDPRGIAVTDQPFYQHGIIVEASIQLANKNPQFCPLTVKSIGDGKTEGRILVFTPQGTISAEDLQGLLARLLRKWKPTIVKCKPSDSRVVALLKIVDDPQMRLLRELFDDK